MDWGTSSSGLEESKSVSAESNPESPFTQELRRLLSSPEPSRKLYGLLRLEERSDEVEESQFQRIAELFRDETDPVLARVFERIRRQIEARESSRTETYTSLFFPDPPDPDAEKVATAAQEALDSLLGTLLERTRHFPTHLIERTFPVWARVPTPDAIQFLVECLDHPELFPRAVEVLHELPHPAAQTALEHRSGGTSPCAWLALAARASHGDPGARERLRLGLNGEISDPVLERLCPWLRRMKPDPIVAKALENRLESASEELAFALFVPYQHHAGASALARILGSLEQAPESARLRSRLSGMLRDYRSEEAQRVLKQLLEDPDDRVRANAIEALGVYETTPDRAWKLFHPFTQDGQRARVRGNAALALHLNRPPSAIEAVLDMFESHEGEIRRAAAYCAGVLQHPRTTRRLVLALRTEQDHRVLRTAFRTLSILDAGEARQALEDFASKAYGPIGVEAIRSLVEVGSPESIPRFLKLLRQSPEAAIRRESLEALRKLAPQRAFEWFSGLLRDPNEGVAIRALQALAESSALEAVPLLQAKSGSESPRFEAHLAAALFRLGDLRQTKVLEDLLRDSGEEMAGVVIEAIQSIGDCLQWERLPQLPLLESALSELHRRSHPDQYPSRRPPPPSRPPATQVLPLEELPLKEEAAAPPPEEVPDPHQSRARKEDRQRRGDLEAIELQEENYHRRTSSPKELLEHLEACPGSAPLLHQCLQAADRLSDAQLKRLAELALGQDDLFANASLALVRALRGRGMTEAALSIQFRTARQLAQLFEELSLLGEDALAGGDTWKAKEVSNLFSHLLHPSPEMHAQVAELYAQTGPTEQALGHGLKAFLASPHDGRRALRLAQLAQKSGRDNLAQASLKAAYRRVENPEASEKLRQALRALEAKRDED